MLLKFFLLFFPLGLLYAEPKDGVDPVDPAKVKVETLQAGKDYYSSDRFYRIVDKETGIVCYSMVSSVKYHGVSSAGSGAGAGAGTSMQCLQTKP